ncbi:uncharacterized protein SCHCODRAFT_01150679 [Schizophyllum commune H4-8]|nr:uncharacterized protein SCHCODRAFT_01150679 [Schizophyllum commune H4-8]KAI5896587.1 hypothetical protein SCHCODRAFT_01150679 [Schizophyllum commune H4-8]
MLASSVPTQVVPTNLPEHILSIIASQLARQSQLEQQGPSASTTASSARLPATSKAACHLSAVPQDSAPPPATSDAVPAQLVAEAHNVVAQSSSSAPRSATASRGSSFKDGHVELSGNESFGSGICVLPVLAPWEAIRSLTVTCPITINDLHLILYQATKLERAVFSSIVQDTKKARCRVDINVNNLRELIIEDVRTPIGSIFDDLEALELEEILVSYTSTSALCEDEDGYCQFLEDMAQDRKPGNIIIYSNDSWYRDARAQGLQEQLEASSNWTAAVI